MNGVLVANQVSVWLAWAMGVYVFVMLGLSIHAHRRVQDLEDFVLAGRQLSTPFAVGTLFATWFGAGTLLTSADEVSSRGLSAATLDPFGAGLCLILAGLVFAGPMWRAQLTTLPELFERRFGILARRYAAVLAILPYLGWIAAQFVALAQIIELFFGIPAALAMAMVACVGILYTIIGGMWAVTLTDSVQLILIVGGVLAIGISVFSQSGDGSIMAGVESIWSSTSAERRAFISTKDLGSLTAWIGVLCAGALGNIPSQDIMQRIFAARSAQIAKRACLISGILYLTIGAIPVMLGLAGATILGDDGGNVIPRLALTFLNPFVAVVFCLAVMSAILSTIDSALLAPATMLAHDLMASIAKRPTEIRWVRSSVLLIGGLSLLLGYLGESAFSLLESGYELGMVSLMAPLVFALFSRRGGQWSVMSSMVLGTVLWGLHMAYDWSTFLGQTFVPLPQGIGCTIISFVVFPMVARFESGQETQRSSDVAA